MLNKLCLNCHSTCPMPQRILLSKRTSRLYESLLSSHVGGRLASARRICWFWSPSSMENSIFHEISSFDTCHGSNHANLDPAQTFSISYGLSWGFAWAKLWYQWQLEKYSWRKRIGSSMRNLHFSIQILHIVCASIATQHARCHKEYYSPRGQTVSTNHFSHPAQRQFCINKTILHVEGHLSSTD